MSLAAKQAELHQVVHNVKILEEQLAKAQADQKELQDQADLCEARVGRAAKLSSALGEEQIAWTQQVQDLDEQLTQIVGAILLSAECVTYLGPFNAAYRQRMLHKAKASCHQHDIDVTDHFSLRATLATDVQVRHLTICGLPSGEKYCDDALPCTLR